MTKRILTSVDIKGTTVFRDDVTVDAPHLFEVGGDLIYWGPVTDDNHVATKEYVDTTVNEVHIGTSDPGTSYDLWFDTDAELTPQETYGEIRWNSAWGLVAYAEVLVGQTGITTEADLTGCAVTFTAINGRRYRVTAQTSVSSTVAQDTVWMQLKTAAGVQKQIGIVRVVNANVAETIPLSFVSLGTDIGTTSWKLTIARATGSGTIATGAQPGYPSFILVEDIGPVTAAAPITDPTPSWMALTLENGWANYGSFYSAAYRKVGDTVQFRGQVSKSSNPFQTICTFPVGYRPARDVLLVGWASWNSAAGRGALRLDLFTTGVLVVSSGTYNIPSGAAAPTMFDHLGLDNLSFSVTL